MYMFLLCAISGMLIAIGFGRKLFGIVGIYILSFVLAKNIIDYWYQTYGMMI